MHFELNPKMQRVCELHLIGEPLSQSGRSMKAEDLVAVGIRLEEIRESGFDARGLVAKRKGATRRRNTVRFAFTVFLRLDLDADQGGALFLGLDQSGCLSADE